MIAVSSTGHGADFVEDTRTVMTLPLCGSATVAVDDDEFLVRPGDMFVLGPSERKSRLRPGSPHDTYESFTVITPENRPPDLQSLASGLRSAEHFSAPDTRREKLTELLRFCFEFLATSELVTSRSIRLQEALIEDALIETLTPTAGIRRRPNALANRAADIIEESYADAITVTDLAAILGTPLRTLQKQFRAAHGITVRDYLSSVRLSALRRALETGGEEVSVTSAALDAGLFHLGRASAAYRRRFGELPSETLRRNDGGRSEGGALDRTTRKPGAQD